ncbi:hypothetical protein CDV31_001438 [Fusarium ambrosium]|uniref:MaoC-like domain-containing protein n=1 Tax=Fusarium ambrosium TaxID=131363 RepID=A0A428UZZ8_9HYPO|nr:hypothetical protein CDV31_001438 [Fusarium ambrosium]
MPSHLLTTTLTDLISPASPTPSTPKISSPPIPLPQGHHLVYFPIQLPPSKLIPDGADPDHSPDPHPPSHSISLTPSATHLFHFSALSFNAHSIHIDPIYAKEVDGHRALLVHGPLTLALMLRVLNDHIGPALSVSKFSYRNYAPLYVDEKMTINLRKVSREDAVEERWDVWIEGPEGGMAVKGNAHVAPINTDTS